jgi:hypothetical protein
MMAYAASLLPVSPRNVRLDRGGFFVMRRFGAGGSAERVSSTTTWFAWGLAAAFFGFVAPFAVSSPYPTPSRLDWSVQQVPAQIALASASSFSLASASSTPVRSATASVLPAAVSLSDSGVESAPLVTTVRTLSIRRPIGEAPEPEADRAIVTASLGSPTIGVPDRAPRRNAAADDIDDYLWEVYQRQPLKRDRGGDFTWKDPAAAKRVGKTLQSYVISGMDPDFREQLYHAGKAMDAAGIEWTIVSGFRDDWRQSIASGIKARTGYSRHGGSRAVGGYGNGLAVDLGHVDRSRSDMIFRWIDSHGGKYGLFRPYRHFDPPHIEPRGDFRRLASNLRKERVGATAEANAREPARARSTERQLRVARAPNRQARNRRTN